MKQFIQVLKFTAFSASAGIIEIASFTLMYELFFWEYWVSYLISVILSVLWNFTFNRRFTFKSATNIPIAMALVFGFYVVFTPTSLLLGDYFVQSLGINEYIVTAVSMILNFILEFLFCKFVVYRNKENTIKKVQNATEEIIETEENTEISDEHTDN